MILTLVMSFRGRRLAKASIQDADEQELQKEIECFCRTLRILTQRDIDGTVAVVFRSMFVEGREPIGSSKLAKLTKLNRVTIIHHLQRLEQMGLVEHVDRRYRLKVSDFSEVVEQMRAEMERAFKEAEELAQELDRQFMLRLSQARQGLEFENQMQKKAGQIINSQAGRQKVLALRSPNQSQAKKRNKSQQK